MWESFSFKELYNVVIKATYPIEMQGRVIEPGEVICVFDKIQIANFQEVVRLTTASGGYGNAAHIYWENVSHIPIDFVQGVFSKEQFALMTNAKLLAKPSGEDLIFTQREILETNDESKIVLKSSPLNPIFCYDADGVKITEYAVNDRELTFDTPYKKIVVDYQTSYAGNYSVLNFGQGLIDGYVSLQAKTRVKDDITGHTRTGLIKIPKLKILSNLSIRLGSNANPMVGLMRAHAIPEGRRSAGRAMELYILDNDIDSDM